MAVNEWEIRVTNELLTWVETLDERTKALVVDAVDRLAEVGPPARAASGRLDRLLIGPHPRGVAAWLRRADWGDCPAPPCHAGYET